MLAIFYDFVKSLHCSLISTVMQGGEWVGATLPSELGRGGRQELVGSFRSKDF